MCRRGGVIADGRLIHAVAQEEVLDQTCLIARVEHPVTGADQRLVVFGQRVRHSNARGPVVLRRVDVTRRRIVGIDDSRLGNGSVFVSDAVVEQQAGIDPELVLPIEAIVDQVGVDNWISEGLGIGIPVLGASRVSAEIESKLIERAVAVASVLRDELIYVILGMGDVESELHGVRALGPAQIVGDLITCFARIQARVRRGNA